MSGIGSTLSKAVSGAPQSIMSGEGIFGSLAHAISPVTGGLYDAATAIAGMSLLSGAMGGGGGGLFGGGDAGGGLFGGGSSPLGGGQAVNMGSPSSISSLGPPAGNVAGMPYYSASQYANYGPNAPGASALGGYSAAAPPSGPSAYFAPPVPPPPPALANPAGGSGSTAPVSGNLSPAGGIANLQQNLNAPGFAGNANFAGANPQQQNQPSTLQSALGASGSVSQAYASYINNMNQLKYHPEYAATHSSPVTPLSQNPLQPAQGQGVAIPQLVV